MCGQAVPDEHVMRRRAWKFSRHRCRLQCAWDQTPGAGLRFAWTEYPPADWDTHTNHMGMFAWQAGRMAKSIAALYAELGELSKGMVVMTCTEFGRTVAENGSGGTDHGRATCFFLMGRDVAGGKVYGSVPPLAPENLEDERDLPVTTDFRSVFAEVAAHQLGATGTAKLFPGWGGERSTLCPDWGANAVMDQSG